MAVSNIVKSKAFCDLEKEITKYFSAVNFSSFYEAVNTFNSICMSFKKTTKRKPPAKSYAKRITELIENCTVDKKLLEARISEIIKNNSFGYLRILSQDAKTISCDLYCPNCGFVDFSVSREKGIKIEAKDDVSSEVYSIKCPHCGKKIILPSETVSNYNKSCKRIKLVFWQKASQEYIVLHKFNLVIMFDMASKKTEYSLFEEKRAGFSNKHCYVYNTIPLSAPTEKSIKDACKNIDFRLNSKTGLDSFVRNYPCFCINTSEELTRMITESDFRYSGLLEAWGLGKNKDMMVDGPTNFSDKSYIYCLLNYSCIEQLLKVGLFQIVKDIYLRRKGSLFIDTTKTTVCEILGITKPELKILQKTQIEASRVKMLRLLYDEDNTLTAELYSEMVNMIDDYRIEMFLKIKKEFNISYDKSLNYLKRCAQFQCISEETAIGLWDDYLSMSKDIGYNLKNKSTKFPESLKKEHDIVTSVFNTISKEFDQEAFRKKAEENKHFNYSLKELNMFVKVPETAQEVVSEGMDLHHCVARYVNPIIKGASIVCFIRSYSAPDESYYTVEIVKDNDGKYKIIQVRGMMDEEPNESTTEGKKIMFFVKKWAKFKNLCIESI